MKHLVLVCSLVALLAGGASAALVWENPSVDLHPAVTDQTAVAHFKYKNTGKKSVKITGVHPSCGCTTAALSKDVVGPGESGEIVATFHIGDRTGLQNKIISVTTDAPDAKATELSLHATIPVVLNVNPYFLYWRKIDPLNPKTITAKIGGDYPVTSLQITCTDKDVNTQWKYLPDQKAFEIIVTPHPGDRPVNAQLQINPGFPKDKPKLYAAYLRIDAHPTGVEPSSPDVPQRGEPAAPPPAASASPK
ncbi:MAG TPA: DUF1573 domain-containing protein [Chthoniobacterales bacterium]|jgi:hypothetical protein